MDRVLIVILNYKSYELTINLLKQLQNLNYSFFDVMVIDNSSPNESAQVLSSFCSQKGFVFFANCKNNGYASGNNIGLKYSVNNGYQYTWILNNDIVLTDFNILSTMLDIFCQDEKIGCVGSKIYDLNGNVCSPYCDRPSFWSMTFGIFEEKKKRNSNNNISQYVYRIHGCSMLLKNSVLKEINYLDERTFLYCEEDILAEKLRGIGIKTYYTATTSLIHLESATVKLNKDKAKMKAKQLCKSMDIYLKDYRHFGLLSRELCKVVRVFIVLLRG